MTRLAEMTRRCREYRPPKTVLLAACLASFGLSVAVGFASGGWVTGGRAQTMTAEAAEDARVDLAAAICAHRFMAAPDATARLAALRRGEPWYRGLMLESAGWTSLPGLRDLPGHHEPVIGEADACAEQLMAMRPPPSHLAALAPAKDPG